MTLWLTEDGNREVIADWLGARFADDGPTLYEDLIAGLVTVAGRLLLDREAVEGIPAARILQTIALDLGK